MWGGVLPRSPPTRSHSAHVSSWEVKSWCPSHHRIHGGCTFGVGPEAGETLGFLPGPQPLGEKVSPPAPCTSRPTCEPRGCPSRRQGRAPLPAHLCSLTLARQGHGHLCGRELCHGPDAGLLPRVSSPQDVPSPQAPCTGCGPQGHVGHTFLCRRCDWQAGCVQGTPIPVRLHPGSLSRQFSRPPSRGAWRLLTAPPAWLWPSPGHI